MLMMRLGMNAMRVKVDKWACAAGGLGHHLKFIISRAELKDDEYIIPKWIIEHAQEYVTSIYNEKGELNEVFTTEIEG